MLVLKVLLIAMGVHFVATGVFNVYWGARFRDGHPLPMRMWSSPDKPEEDREFGRQLAAQGRVQIAFFGMVALAGLGWLLRDDRMSVGDEELRLFSNSTQPVLDVVKMIAATVITIFIYLNTLWIFRGRRPERPRRGAWGADTDSQSRRTGIALISWGTASCVTVVGICVFLTARFMTGTTNGPIPVITPPIVFLSAPTYVVGLNLRRKGRRHLAQVLASPEELDAEPFALYLRSFQDDASFDAAQIRPGMPALIQFLISGRSEEEQIARAVRRIGRLVAVGEPGERLPYVGADRLYLPIDGWHEPVRELITRARLVLLAVGPGEGTMWELVECMRLLPPNRLVLLVPLEQDGYEVFRQDARKRLAVLANPPPLPPYQPDPRIKSPMMSSRLKAVVRYSADGNRWQATFVWLESEAMQIRRLPLFRDMVYVALKHALLPTVEHLVSKEEHASG